MTFSESCRELMKSIKDLEHSTIESEVITLQFRKFVRRERLARARDEVAHWEEVKKTVGLSQYYKFQNYPFNEKIEKRIADLEKGIKILEGGR